MPLHSVAIVFRTGRPVDTEFSGQHEPEQKASATAIRRAGVQAVEAYSTGQDATIQTSTACEDRDAEADGVSKVWFRSHRFRYLPILHQTRHLHRTAQGENANLLVVASRELVVDTTKPNAPHAAAQKSQGRRTTRRPKYTIP